MTENTKVFTKGMVVKQPRENAPSFVKGSIAFKVTEFVEFLHDHAKPDGWVNCDILESKDGTKWYGCVNHFVPKTKETREEITADDSPF